MESCCCCCFFFTNDISEDYFQSLYIYRNGLFIRIELNEYKFGILYSVYAKARHLKKKYIFIYNTTKHKGIRFQSAFTQCCAFISLIYIYNKNRKTTLGSISYIGATTPLTSPACIKTERCLLNIIMFGAYFFYVN